MTATDKHVRPFPHDEALSIKEGAPVYFAWQTLIKDPESGEMHCIVARTKSAVVRAMVRSGHDLDLIDLEKIIPAALLSPQGITTKSAGRISPLDFETSETVEKNVRAAKDSAKKKTPPPVVDDEDDLI